jgi:hypothetical protein
MSAEFSLTAVAVVRALLNEDIEGLAVRLPDGLPSPAAFRPGLALSLNNLSADLAGLGRQEDALAAIHEARHHPPGAGRQVARCLPPGAGTVVGSCCLARGERRPQRYISGRPKE